MVAEINIFGRNKKKKCLHTAPAMPYVSHSGFIYNISSADCYPAWWVDALSKWCKTKSDWFMWGNVLTSKSWSHSTEYGLKFLQMSRTVWPLACITPDTSKRNNEWWWWIWLCFWCCTEIWKCICKYQCTINAICLWPPKVKCDSSLDCLTVCTWCLHSHNIRGSQ